MAVVSVSGASAVCEWFHDGKMHKGEFPAAALDLDGDWVSP